MAKLSVTIVADAASLKRGLKEGEAAVGSFSGTVKSAEGRLGSMLGTVKTVGLGLVGFGAGIAAADLFKSSITAAENFDAALRGTRRAVESTGGAFPAYKSQVLGLADAGARLGYSNTQVLQGYQALTLTTGNATDALHYMGLVEDLAKARGLSLSSAATAVGKAIDGKTAALQRYGVVVQKGQSIEEALTQAQKRYGGQALANTTVTQQLQATVQNLEQKIGAVLLPVVQEVAAKFEAWISKTRNQKTVIDDLKTAVSIASTAFHGIKDAIDAVDKVTGSFKHTVELLIGLKFAVAIGKWTGSLGLLSSAAKIAAAKIGLVTGAEEAVGPAAAASAAEAETAMGGIASAAIAAAGPVAALAAGLAALYFWHKANGFSMSQGGSLVPTTGTTQSFHTAGGQEVYQKDGKWYTSNVVAGSKAGTISHSAPISQAQAEKMAKQAGVNINVTPGASGAAGTAHGGGGGLGPVPQSPAEAARKAAAAARAAQKKAAQVASSFQGGPGGSGPPPATTAGGSGSKGKTAPAYKIPQTLEAEIRRAQQTFADNMTRQHLDTVISLERKEEALLKAHGQDAKAASVGNEITKQQLAYQKHLAAVQLKAATSMISDLDATTAGPAQAIKLATAAGAPATEILADQQALMTAQQTEAATLRTKLRTTTGAAKAAIKNALTRVNANVKSTEDSVVQSLQGIAQQAQSKLQTVIGSIESAADQALGAQYYQGGLQTPAEAQLAAMQQQDTAQGLADALTAAQQQVASDTAAGSGVSADQLKADQKAVTQAQRAIDENNLAIEAANERAAADTAYATQTANLNTAIETLSGNVGDGSGAITGLTGILSGFGISLGDLSDPGGNNLLGQLAGAAADTTSAFSALTDAVNASSVALGGKKGKKTAAQGVPAGGIDNFPSYALGGPTGQGGLALLHPGEFVVPKSGALVSGASVRSPRFAVPSVASAPARAADRRGGGGIVFQPGSVVVNGTADTAFAKVLAAELATQLRGGRVPQLAQAITGLG